MAETQAARKERILRELRAARREGPFGPRRQPVAPGGAFSIQQVDIPGGFLRGPENLGEGLELGAQVASQFIGAGLGSKAVGPAANVLRSLGARRAGAATQLAGRVAGSATGGAGGNALTGQDPAAGAVAGALGEGIGAGLGPVANRIGAAASRNIIAPGLRGLGKAFPGVARLTKLQPGTNETLKILADEAGERVTPTMGQVSSSDFVRRVESALEGSFGGRGVLEQAYDRADDVATAATQRFVNKYVSGASREARGELIDEAVRDGTKVFRRAAAERYAQVDQLTRRSVVDLDPIKARLARQIEEEGVIDPRVLKLEKNLGKIGTKRIDTVTRRGEPILFDESGRGISFKEITEQVTAISGQIPFKKAHNLRSALLEITRSPSPLIGTPERRFAGKLAKQVDEAMEAAATRIGPDAIQAFRGANSFWKGGAKDFNDKNITALLNKAPEDMASFVLRSSGKTRSTLIARLERITRDVPEGRERVMEPLRAHLLAELIEKSSGGQIIAGSTDLGFASGAGLARNLNAFDDRALATLFGAGPAKEFRRLARAMEQSQSRATSSSSMTKGMPSVQLMQLKGMRGQTAQLGGAGAVALGGSAGVFLGDTDPKVAVGGALAAGSLILLGPRALAKFMSNPSNVRLLADGALAPIGSRTAARLAGQLTSRFLDLQRVYGRAQVHFQSIEEKPEEPITSSLPLPGAFQLSPQATQGLTR